MSKSGSISTSVSGGLTVGLGLTGSAANPITVDAGLSDIGISVTGDPNKALALDLGLKATGDANAPIALKASGDPANPLSLKMTGDPNNPLAIDLGLTVHVDQLDIKLEPLEIKLDPLEIKLDPLKIDLGLDNINVCLSLAVTEFPRMQMHMPKEYDFGFSLFGMPVVGFSICGNSSIITEDNPPRVFQRFKPAAAAARHDPGAHSGSDREEPFRVVLS